MEWESSKEYSVFFLWTRKAFGCKIVLRGIQRCFLQSGAQNVLFKIHSRQQSFRRLFRYIPFFTFLKGNLCMYKIMFYKCFINFVIGTKEKLQNAPRFKTDFVVLNFARCSSNNHFTWFQINLLVIDDKFSRNNFTVYCFEFVHSQNRLKTQSQDYSITSAKMLANFIEFLLPGSVSGHFSIRNS